MTGVFVAQLLLTGAVTVAAFVLRALVPVFHDQQPLLWAGLAFAILQGFSPVWYFTGQERIPLIGAITVGVKLIATLAIFALVRAPEDGWLVLACYAGGALLATAIGYGLVLREVRPGRPSLGLVGRTLRLGASMFLTRIAFMMHTAGNVFLLGLLVVPHQVAFYAASEKLCRPVAWLMQPINTALLPRLSHLVGASPERAQQLASLTFLLQGATGVVFGLTVGRAAWLVDLMFGPEYIGAVEVLRVMAAIIPADGGERRAGDPVDDPARPRPPPQRRARQQHRRQSGARPDSGAAAGRVGYGVGHCRRRERHPDRPAVQPALPRFEAGGTGTGAAELRGAGRRASLTARFGPVE